jgi:hypothetical protein
MSDDNDVRFENLDDINRELDDIKDRLPKALQDGLQAVGFLVIGESKEMTPVDNGFLIGSAYVSDAAQLGSKAVVEMGYGAEYAPYVHEATNETLRGDPRQGSNSRGNYWDGGESEYLLKAMEQNRGTAKRLFRKQFFRSLARSTSITDRPSDTPDTPENTGTPDD